MVNKQKEEVKRVNPESINRYVDLLDKSQDLVTKSSSPMRMGEEKTRLIGP